MAAKRLSRKELLKKDEIQSTMFRYWNETLDFLQENAQKIIIAVVIVVALMGLVQLYMSWQTKKETKASTLLAKGINVTASAGTAEERSWDRKNLEEVIRQYPNSDAAPFSLFYTGLSLTEDFMYEEAAEKYETFLDKYGGHPLRPRVMTNLALTYEQLGRYDKAEELYEKLVQLEAPAYPNEMALLDLAEFYERRKRYQEAIEIYARIKENDESPIKGEVSLKIDELTVLLELKNKDGMKSE